MKKPTTIDELAAVIARASAPFELVSCGTKRALGNLPSGKKLDLSAFKGIINYEPEELVLEVGAATKLDEVIKLLRTHNQMLAFDPPDYAQLLGARQPGSMAGLVACNLSGSRRISAGAVRDHLLGLSAVSGRGEVFKAGARVVKNVTGYDLPKLMTGSFGTLAAFTSLIFKVLPKPETEQTLCIPAKSDADAVKVLTRAMQSSCEVSAAAYLPGESAYLRLEGISKSISYRKEKLLQALGGDASVLDEKASAQTWRRIRDVELFADNSGRHVWKISIPPQDATAFLLRLKGQFEFRYFMDWAGGLIWLDHAPLAAGEIIRKALTSGHATLIRADDESRSKQNVFQPQTQALSQLILRVKQSFDPNGLLNPFRISKSF